MILLLCCGAALANPLGAEIAGAPTILVTNANNSGPGSLRQAVIDANAAAGPDAIEFAIPGAPPHVITLTTESLPLNTDDLAITGLADPADIVIDGNLACRPFHNDAGAKLTLQRLTIRNGLADIFGGGALRNQGEAIVEDCVITKNTAFGAGGGIVTSGAGSTLTISRSVISNNNVTGSHTGGGGLAIRSNSSAIVNHCSIFINFTTINGICNGGGILVESGGLTLFSSFVGNNFAGTFGGGLFGNGAIQIVNSTISTNRATSSGGGIRQEGGAMSLHNSTITGNVADLDNNGTGDGGGYSISAGAGTLSHCLIAGNIDRGGQRDDLDGLPGSIGYNLIGTVGTLDFSTNSEGDQYGDPNNTTTPDAGVLESATAIDPLLTLMALDLGGVTPVFGLMPGSPAINAGDPKFVEDATLPSLDFDQRGEGFPRIVGDKIDIGAFESGVGPDPNTVPLIVDIKDDANNGIFVPGERSLREAMILADGRPSPNAITFAIAGAAPHVIVLTADLPANTKILSITGPGDPRDLIIDGDNLHRPFENKIGAELVLENLTITRGYNNLSGGGIRSDGGSLKILNCRVTHCVTDGVGGAVSSKFTQLLVERSLISHNRAGVGGGFDIIDSGSFLCRDSTISDNFSSDAGGGMYLATSSLILNSTISGNKADSGGGGAFISHLGNGFAVFRHCTITRNIADFDQVNGGFGGGLFDFAGGAELLFSHCIIAGNTDSAGDRPDISQGSSLGYNLIGNAGALEFATNTTGDIYGDPQNTTTPNPGATESAITITPLLSSLAGFGGAMPVHKPIAGSPAIDAGDPNFDPNDFQPPLNEDQRGAGIPRVLNGRIDIGAVESDGSPIVYVVDTAEDEDDGDTSAGDLSLREAMILANESPNADLINFAIPGPAPHTITLTLGDLPTILDDVRVIGPGAPEDLVIDGDTNYRPFFIFSGPTVSLENLTITRSKAATGPGGGVRSLAGQLTIRNCKITQCETGENGGAVDTQGGDLIVERTLIHDNYSGARGGGLNVWGNGSLLCRDSTISDNFAMTYGGGIGLEVQAEIINTTISGNEAYVDGGGLIAEGGSGFAYLRHCTIVDNTADSDNDATGTGGGMIQESGGVQIVLDNTLVALNNEFSGVRPDIAGVIQSFGHNLIGSVGATDFAANTTGDQYGDPGGTTTPNTGALESAEAIYPFVGPLGEYGGPTPTHALLAISPARNAGDPNFDPAAYDPPLTTDQRGAGFARVSDGRIDIGAFESAQPVALCRDIVVSIKSGQAEVRPEEVDNGSFDPDGPYVTLEITPPGPYDVGETKVTLTAMDNVGLTSECEATITVEIINAHGWMTH